MLTPSPQILLLLLAPEHQTKKQRATSGLIQGIPFACNRFLVEDYQEHYLMGAIVRPTYPSYRVERVRHFAIVACYCRLLVLVTNYDSF